MLQYFEIDMSYLCSLHYGFLLLFTNIYLFYYQYLQKRKPDENNLHSCQKVPLENAAWLEQWNIIIPTIQDTVIIWSVFDGLHFLQS